MSHPRDPPPIHLDGTTLEGGGQLLRLALSLSSLTRTPIHVTKIRGKRGTRSNPGDAGGLKPAHLAGAVWLAKATNAETVGMKVKSRELVFRPEEERGGERVLAEAEAEGGGKGVLGEGEQEWWRREPDDGVWENIYEDGRLVRRESHIPMSTPGSIFLVLQAILPYILFSSPPAPAPSQPCNDSSSQPSTAHPPATTPVPIRLKIEGGTNAFHSLSFEYASQVLFPMLALKLGIEPITMKLHWRGWSMGRADVGSVTFDIMPLGPTGSRLQAFSFEDRGAITSFHVSILAPTSFARLRIRESVTEKLIALYPALNPHIDIKFPVDEDSKHPKRLYLLIVASSSNGYRLGRDWLFDRKIYPEHLNIHIKELVDKVVGDLEREIAHGGCVDEYMQDQLVVFQALAEGRAVVDGGGGREASLHTRTARWVCEQILGIGFESGWDCEGVGLRVGMGK